MSGTPSFPSSAPRPASPSYPGTRSYPGIEQGYPGGEQASEVEYWFVEFGPQDVRTWTLEQLDDAYRLDLITGDTLVRNPEMQEWVPLREVAGLNDDEEEIYDVEEVVDARLERRPPESGAREARVSAPASTSNSGQQALVPAAYAPISYPVQGYPVQGYPVQGYPVQGYPVQGYSASPAHGRLPQSSPLSGGHAQAGPSLSSQPPQSGFSAPPHSVMPSVVDIEPDFAPKKSAGTSWLFAALVLGTVGMVGLRNGIVDQFVDTRAIFGEPGLDTLQGTLALIERVNQEQALNPPQARSTAAALAVAETATAVSSPAGVEATAPGVAKSNLAVTQLSALPPAPLEPSPGALSNSNIANAKAHAAAQSSAAQSSAAQSSAAQSSPAQSGGPSAVSSHSRGHDKATRAALPSTAGEKSADSNAAPDDLEARMRAAVLGKKTVTPSEPKAKKKRSAFAIVPSSKKQKSDYERASEYDPLGGGIP